MKKYFTFFCLSLISAYGFSQSGIPTVLNIKSPETYEFTRSGNLPISQYSGSVNLSIPLLAVDAFGKNLNIDLDYNSSGFIPSKRPAIVGLNWLLNVGGVVTREIKGKPDDWIGNPTTSAPGDGQIEHGFLVGVRRHTFLPSSIYNFDPSTSGNACPSCHSGGEWLLSTGVDAYESTPDKFNFNFLGISGYFYIGNDGIPKVVCYQQNNLKIDIAGISDQRKDQCKPDASEITITDNEGTKYYFGGETRNLEFSNSLGNQFTDHIDEPAGGFRSTITGWFLRKVQLLNGKVITLNYMDDSSLASTYCKGIGSMSQYAASKKIISINKYTQFSREDFNWTQTGIFGDHMAGSDTGNPGTQYSYELLKRALLINIQFDNTTISFTYGDQPNLFYPDFSGSPSVFNQVNPYLSDIKLIYSGTTIKTISFNYSYLGTTPNKRMFLNTVAENNETIYSFEYYKTNSFPRPDTCGVDYWGFWNGLDGQDFTYLVPTTNYNLQTGDFTYTGNSRRPDPSKCDVGLLKKIIYHTKGYSEFEYEPNTYSKKLDRISANDFMPKLVDENGIAGGARIKAIKDHDGTSYYNIREFKYIRNYSPLIPSNQTSSGILMDWPRYIFRFYAPNNGYGGTSYEKRMDSKGFISNTLDNTHITYGEVTEVKSNGYSKFTFNDYLSNPDKDDEIVNIAQLSGAALPMNLYINYVGLVYNDRSIERGKLRNELIYDTNFNPKSETNYTYNVSSNKYDNFITNIHASGPVVQAHKIYYYPYYETKKEQISHLNTDYNLTTNTTYDNYNNIKTLKTYSSQGEDLLTENTYCYDLTTPITQNMQLDNIVGVPILTKTYRNSQLLNWNETGFTKDPSTGNLIKPKYNYSKKGNNSLEKNITYDFYDAQGNITQYTLENGIHVSIIWGYNNTKPIAKLENIEYGDISPTAIADLKAKSNNDNDHCTTLPCSGNEGLLLTALNSLRATYTVAMVTTYTYDPLIGITSITDAKGLTSYYEYDTFGRLKNIKDAEWNKLSENEYNFKP